MVITAFFSPVAERALYSEFEVALDNQVSVTFKPV